MKKKIVVFGGGTGLSTFVSGIKDYPVEINAIITVSDSGGSTGILREEFNMPGVGDIRRVISSMSGLNSNIKSILEYRFETSSDLDGHALGNLMLTAFYNKTKSLTTSIKYMSKLMDLSPHKVIPITEDNVTLIAHTFDGEMIVSEKNIDHSDHNVTNVSFKEKGVKVNPDVLKAIEKADLIIYSMGSLYTSLLPNLILPEVKKALKKSKAPKLYINNMINSPTESYKYKASDYIKKIEETTGCKLDALICSNTNVPEDVKKKYFEEEKKEVVEIDREEIKKLGVELIEEDLMIIKGHWIRHNTEKLALTVFNYLMR